MTDQRDRRESYSAAAEDIRQRARADAAELKQAAREQAEAAGERLVERGAHVADAVRSAGDTLRGQEDWLADAADSLGDTIDRLSASLREKGADGVRRDVEHLARERPVLFMTAAIGVGVALGRLLRSSPPPPRRPYDENRRGPGASQPTGGSYERYEQSGAAGGGHGAH